MSIKQLIEENQKLIDKVDKFLGYDGKRTNVEDMITVLTTGGKREDFYKVRVDTFETIEEAQAHINKINKDKDDKYWYRAYVIEQGKYYEPDQEELYDSQY